MSEPLYAIVAKYHDDLAKLQDLDLPPEVVLDTIESMQGEIESKVRAVVAYAIDLEKAADARADEAARMKDGADRLSARAESLKMYAQIALMNSGLKLPLIAPEFTLNLAKNPRPVDVVDVAALPDTLVKTTVTIKFAGRFPEWSDALTTAAPDGADVSVDVKPIKTLIGDALKADTAVPGAKFGPQSFRLTVR